MFSYIPSILRAHRRQTREVRVGEVMIGGRNPIVVQSMTTTPTTDTQGTIRQMEKLLEVGCEIVRLTVPTQSDMDNIPNIRAEMKRLNMTVPLVADIHFMPKLALQACDYFEKVRVNPGNFADKKKFEIREYTDAQYQEELERIQESFSPIVRRAKLNGIAIRVGTNHGSLSDRIMNRFGDTPMGMVESALEFIRIAQDESFHDIVISMKSSNPQVMVHAYRLLVSRMNELKMDYPLHLGVTEAGDGEDGRIKSAMGIGSLLADGLGDTIRVSLTEDPEHEIPVAKRLAALYEKPFEMKEPAKVVVPSWDFYTYQRRETSVMKNKELSIGGRELIRVATPVSIPALAGVKTFDFEPPIEKISVDVSQPISAAQLEEVPSDIVRLLRLTSATITDIRPERVSFDEIALMPSTLWTEETYLTKMIEVFKDKIVWFRITKESQMDQLLDVLQVVKNRIACGVEIEGPFLVDLGRWVATSLTRAGLKMPIHLRYLASSNASEQETIIRASVEIGALLTDGIGDSVEIHSAHAVEFNHRLGFNVLQAARLRMSKTEYIACPSCGRTLFDLQETTAKIRAKTNHLKGVKIAIMGCIVNGPGEMADADFGYVGAGEGQINLYVGKECVERHIPQDNAVEKLVDLIKRHDRWVEPTV